MNKLVEEAPYHPGYEDAVVSPAQKYKGVDPAKMIWNNNELIRQQADRIAELEKDGKVCATCGGLVYDPVIKQTKPLSDEEIFAIAIPTEIDGTDEEVLTFARAIEERHGIK